VLVIVLMLMIVLLTDRGRVLNIGGLMKVLTCCGDCIDVDVLAC
jgi:hypothetical protein